MSPLGAWEKTANIESRMTGLCTPWGILGWHISKCLCVAYQRSCPSFLQLQVADQFKQKIYLLKEYLGNLRN